MVRSVALDSSRAGLAVWPRSAPELVWWKMRLGLWMSNVPSRCAGAWPARLRMRLASLPLLAVSRLLSLPV